MKKIAVILIAFLAFACSPSNPTKTYTVDYTVQAVSQYGDTTIITKMVNLTDESVEFSLYRGDLTMYKLSSRASGDASVIMSGVRYFVLIKSDTIKIR